MSKNHLFHMTLAFPRLVFSKLTTEDREWLVKLERAKFPGLNNLEITFHGPEMELSKISLLPLGPTLSD